MATPTQFDELYYLNANPDVATAVALGAFSSGLQHFQLSGNAEGRAPNAFFDAAAYLQQNPDVAAAIEAGAFASAWDHFAAHGASEGRAPSFALSQFDAEAYLAANPDVAEAGIDALTHWLTFGAAEGRAPFIVGFDVEGYLEANPDVAAAGVDPVAHWLQFGIAEGREGAGVSPTPPPPSPLPELLADLQAAQAALDAFLEAEEATAAEIRDALTDAEAALAADPGGSINQLNADLLDAQDELAAAEAAVDAIPGLRAALNTLDAAEAELEAAAAAQVETEAEAAGAVAEFNVRNPLTLAVYTAPEAGDADEDVLTVGGETVISLDDEGNLVVAAEPEGVGIADLIAAVTADVAAINALGAAEDAVEAAEDAIEDIEGGEAAVDALVAAREAVAEAEAAIAQRLELQAAVDEAQAAVDELDALEQAIADAEDAIIEAGFALPVAIDAAVAGTAEDDIFLFVASPGDAFDVTLFGDEGVDTIFFGEGFTLVQIPEDLTIENRVGDREVLEILWQEIGGDLVLYVENTPEAGRDIGAGAQDDITTITLVGVAAADITFANGFMTAGTADVA
ncbi:MAG: hypothetical protein EA356_14740 [Geminicoccaceae bacterium]|nr:MAG: hypothetical protein EA356_14740 [Geminicoccaceae bacterium]